MSIEKREDIKVRLKKGDWEVEISCPEEKIENTIKSVLSGLSNNIIYDETLKSNKRSKGSSTCRGLIENLWSEGYFISEKNLGEVDQELGRMGYHYDRTAVSHSLTDLVRENVLSRIGSMRNYRYIQKKPAKIES
tara:strand:- start:193 stop:597 length:405 start_codon:yes stop_codon:yes gene_type:complete